MMLVAVDTRFLAGTFPLSTTPPPCSRPPRRDPQGHESALNGINHVRHQARPKLTIRDDATSSETSAREALTGLAWTGALLPEQPGFRPLTA